MTFFWLSPENQLLPENQLPALQEGLKGLPHVSVAFIFVILAEGEEGVAAAVQLLHWTHIPAQMCQPLCEG